MIGVGSALISLFLVLICYSLTLTAKRADENLLMICEQNQKIEEEKLYKVPILTLGYYTYLNTSRLNVPEDLDMGTPGHRCDIKFTEWEIK